jgi:hypothetical protein
MNIPAEFTNRVFKTRFSGFFSTAKQLTEIHNLAEGSEIDVIYEDGRAIVVLVFESQEDCLAFTLKYGDKYA